MKIIKTGNHLIQNGITYEELKKCKGFEYMTETEAEKELETINRIAKILYLMYMNNQQQDE